MRRARPAALGAAGLVALTLLVATPSVPNAAATTQSRSIKAAIKAATPTKAPFPGLSATVVHVGGRALHVVIAKTEAQRELGLRRRSDLGPYDGMLFVFDSTTQVGFTMSTVPVALDIGFYDDQRPGCGPPPDAALRPGRGRLPGVPGARLVPLRPRDAPPGVLPPGPLTG